MIQHILTQQSGVSKINLGSQEQCALKLEVLVRFPKNELEWFQLEVSAAKMPLQCCHRINGPYKDRVS